MKVGKIHHKGLKRFIEKNNPKGVPAAKVDKIRDIITALLIADTLADMPTLPGWNLHRLTGNRAGQWSITITGNLRLTFKMQKDEIHNLDLENYH